MIKRGAFAAAVLGLAACAVPPAPVAYAQGPVPVAERLALDEQRIDEGWRLGQFTRPEYNELQGRHAAIENTRREQFARSGGRIPPGEYRQLEEREEALSRTIYEYRHNGATPSAH